MRICKTAFTILALSLWGASLSAPAHAQGKEPDGKKGSTPAPKPSEAEMMAKMMELAQPGANHQLLAPLAGSWTYVMKFGAAPGAPLTDAGQGTAVRTAIMGGRYFVTDVAGKMSTPGPDGKMMDSEFKGMSVDGYDNVKQKFVSTWMDNMGTSIVLSEGTYDPAARSFTYQLEMEMVPGMKVKAREVLTIVDADHYRMDWYEHHGGQEAKTMEIGYTRKK